jgi:hypothetical protein
VHALWVVLPDACVDVLITRLPQLLGDYFAAKMKEPPAQGHQSLIVSSMARRTSTRLSANLPITAALGRLVTALRVAGVRHGQPPLGIDVDTRGRTATR